MISRGKRVWIMVGGAFVLALPFGMLMRLVPEGGVGESLLSILWLAGVVAWCVWVVKRWSVPPKVAKSPVRAAATVPAGSDVLEAYMYRYARLPASADMWVEVREDYVPGRMQDQVSAFVFYEGDLVGGCTPEWLHRYHDSLPMRLLLRVRGDQAHVLFPDA